MDLTGGLTLTLTPTLTLTLTLTLALTLTLTLTLTRWASRVRLRTRRAARTTHTARTALATTHAALATHASRTAARLARVVVHRVVGNSRARSTAWSKCSRAPSRLLCLLRARLAAPGSSAFPGRGLPTPLRRLRPHPSMVKVAPWQCPRSAPAPPQGAPGSSGWLGGPSAETDPLGAQPLPRVFELAASTAAHSPAFDPSGTTRA